MNYEELVQEVLLITKRPDRLANIGQAVRNATLKAHRTDFYPKDLFETGIQWSIPAYLQSLETKEVVPRWRAIKYLRKYDYNVTTTVGIPGNFFEIVQPESVLDTYRIQKENICYAAGSMLEIRSSTQDAFMLLGCYRYPDITETSFSSWIAEDVPYAIIWGAAGMEFKWMGYDEQEAAMRAAVADEYQLLKQEITGEGS